MNRYPNLFFLGVQKAGSTLAYDLMKNHPEIYLPAEKEPHYFNLEKTFRQGPLAYLNYYKNSESFKYRGDFTPDYLFMPGSIERIKEHAGENSKFIISLRSPASRAYSQYNMMVSRGYNMDSFKDELIKDEGVLKPFIDVTLRPSFLKGRGMYFTQISNLLTFFSKENIKIVIFEEWVKEQSKFLKEIEQFLELSEEFDFHDRARVANPSLIYPKNFFVREIKKVNRILLSWNIGRSGILNGLKNKFKGRIGKIPEKLSKEELIEINNVYFTEDIKKLENLLGRDLSFWYI